MLISALAEVTRSRFKVLDEQASVQAAADAFANAQLGLIVVCGAGELARGVVSKSDLVRHLARAGQISEPCTMPSTVSQCPSGQASDSAQWKLAERSLWPFRRNSILRIAMSKSFSGPAQRAE